MVDGSIMIWGICLNHGESYNLKSLAQQGEIARISQISLDSGGEGKVYISYGSTNLLLASLNSRRPTANISLFFTIAEENIISCIGQSQVRILGYLEPYARNTARVRTVDTPCNDSSSEEIIPPRSLQRNRKTVDSSSEELIGFPRRK